MTNNLRPEGLNELTRVPNNMQRKYNSIQAFQNILQGNTEIINDDIEADEKIETNIKSTYSSDDRPVNKSIESIEKSHFSDPSIDINKLALSLVNTLTNKFDISIKKPLEIKFDAELKIDVLSYTFKYKQFYKTDSMLIFVMSDPFSLDIKEPVKFKLTIANEGLENQPVVCIGSPIELKDLGLRLLIFVFDKL